MRRYLYLGIFIFCFYSFEAHTQNVSQEEKEKKDLEDQTQQKQEKIAHLPKKYFSKVASKTSRLNKRLTKRTEKAVHRVLKQEKEINKKLSKVDSVEKKGLSLSHSVDSLLHLQNALKNKVAKGTSRLPGKKYIPYLDSLQVSLDFFKKYSSSLQKAKGTSKKLQEKLAVLNRAQGEVNQLRSKLDQIHQIQHYIESRKKILTDQLEGYEGLFSKNINRIKKEVYYYKTTAENYKDLWQHPAKVERKARKMLNKIPAFKDFMQKHSILGLLFQVPDNYGDPERLQGLQTRDMVQRELQGIIPQTDGNGSERIEAQMQKAREKLKQLKNKLNGGSGTSTSMPHFKPNDMKTKTFFQRLVYGANIQFDNETGWYPTTSDIALQLGYKFSEKGSAGIGTSFRLGWGNIHKIRFTAQGFGLRSYLDYQIKGSFYVNGGFEFQYNKTIPNIEVLKGWNGWTRKALLGIARKYKLPSPFGQSKEGMTGKVMLLFNFLYRQQIPAVNSPLIFRIGYEF